jgi:cytochrome c-type biogenesis protein CcmH/NrfF
MTRFAAAAACALALASAACAVAATPRTTLPEIEQQVMCVTCGVPLAIAESPQADRERAFIRQLISAGETPAQIRAALVGQFGPSVLALPKAGGFNLVVYIVPIAAVLLVAASLAVTLPRWRRRSAAVQPSLATLDADDTARLEDDLARYDR